MTTELPTPTALSLVPGVDQLIPRHPQLDSCCEHFDSTTTGLGIVLCDDFMGAIERFISLNFPQRALKSSPETIPWRRRDFVRSDPMPAGLRMRATTSKRCQRQSFKNVIAGPWPMLKRLHNFRSLHARPRRLLRSFRFSSNVPDRHGPTARF